LVGHDGAKRVSGIADGLKQRFGVEIGFADGSSAADRAAQARDADVILSAGPAGVNIVTAEQLAAASRLLVAADVNAVPPAGLEGVGVTDDGKPLGDGTALAIGALTVGNVKYQTESGLFRRMLTTEKPLSLDFRDAYALALDIAG
jgi:methylene-tetrahydromethanopterin dehydrogenase